MGLFDYIRILIRINNFILKIIIITYKQKAIH